MADDDRRDRIIDSGASRQLCSAGKLMINQNKSRIMFITSANGKKFPVYSQGDVKVNIDHKKTLLMREVLYVPSLKSNLESASALTKNN